MKINIICALALFALAPTTRAVDPPPDGGYSGRNTAEGEDALFSLTTSVNAVNNTAVGFHALKNNTIGGDNTAIGYNALLKNRPTVNFNGGGNTAIGSRALEFNTTGSDNTATGLNALFRNTTGGGNTAVGSGALGGNNAGGGNTAVGSNALESNGAGAGNTALGFVALASNFSGTVNTASGNEALALNASGKSNTANGAFALRNNKGGDNNTAVGFNALLNNTSGNNNIALGAGAGINLTFGFNNIDIGNQGIANEKRTIRVGTAGTHTATFIAGIRGTATAGMDAVPVVIDSEGQLGTVSSSARFKDEIKPMDKASEAILGLKPVTFHYKSDNTGTAQFGLIAEEVAKANPDLVVRDEKGEIYTVRYDAVNAMLLNEFLKEHRTVEEQGATIARQQKDFESKIARQQKQIETLTTGLRKVSDELQMSKAAPRMISDNQ